MKITSQLTDEKVLEELGARLAGLRLGRNLTQALLAEQAGVSKRTVERLESGEVGTQLSGFLRVCRVLGLLEHFESLIPEGVVGPMEPLRRRGRPRRRATGRRGGLAKPTTWTWGDDK